MQLSKTFREVFRDSFSVSCCCGSVHIPFVLSLNSAPAASGSSYGI